MNVILCLVLYILIMVTLLDFVKFEFTLLDILWPISIPYRLINYHFGKPVNMENFFLRK